MKTNVGIIDSIVRLLAAVIIVGLYFANIITGTLAIVLLVLAGVFILTALICFCPLYLLFGSTTSKK